MSPSYGMLPSNRIFQPALFFLVISATVLEVTSEPASSGRSLVVTAVLDGPFTMHRADFSDRQGNDRFEGFSVDLLSMLAQEASFTYDIRLNKDRQHGRLQSGSKGWTGTIGELVNREVDLAIGGITITDDRTRVVDFTEPFLGSGVAILLKKPTVVGPLDALRKNPLPISNFGQLVNQSDMSYGAYQNGTTMAFFENSTVGLHKKIWNYLSTHPEHNVLGQGAGIARLRSPYGGRYAFIVEQIFADYITNREPCDIVSVGHISTYKGYGIALQKDSPWTQQLSSLIMQWKNDGTIRRLYDKWWNTGKNCKK